MLKFPLRRLLNRTATGDLDLADKRENPRDYMGEYALIYIGLAERLCSERLENVETVMFSQALEIIWDIAKLIREQYLSTQKMLGRDLLTDRPLLDSGEG